MDEKDFKPEQPAPSTTPAVPNPAPTGQATPTSSASLSKPRRGKRRLVLKIVAVLVLLGIILLAAAPTLIGSRPVLSIILGQVNQRLNGRVEVSSLSLGWLGGAKLEGVRVFDSNNAQIAQLDHASVPLPLWKAIFGHLALGEVVIDGVSFDAKYDAQGKLNFATLTKPASSSTAPATPTEKSAEPSKLPNLSGDIKLTHVHGTLSEPGKPTIYLTRVEGHLQIPDINGPITDQLDIALRSGEGREGTVTASGTAAVIKNNVISIGSGEVHQKLDVKDFELAATKPFIANSADLQTLAGQLDAHLNLDMTAASAPGGLQLEVTARDLQYAKTSGPLVNEPLFQLTIKSEFVGSQQSTLQSIKNGVITLTAGSAGDPTLDLLAEVPAANITGEIAADFKLTRLSANLAKLQKEFAAVVTGQAGTVVNSGVLQIQYAGQYSAHTLSIDSLNVDANNLFVSRQLPDGKQISALAGEALKINAAASVAMASAAGGETAIHVKTLTVTDAGQIVDIHKDPAGDFVMTLPAKGGMSGSGQIQIALQLGSLSQIAQVLSQVDAAPTTGGLHSGKLTGVIAITPSAPSATSNMTSLLAKLDLNDLSLNTTNGPAAIEPINLSVNAVGNPTDGSIVIDHLQLNSSFAKASLISPISISKADSKTIINGQLKVEGSVGSLCQTLASYQGKKPGAYPYHGTYTLTETVSSQAGSVVLKGGLQVADFESFDEKGVTFSEHLIAVGNDVALKTAGTGALADQSLNITSLTANMQSSGAVNVSMVNGSIQHLQSSRMLQLPLSLTYDLAKLWPVIQPVMGDQYKELKITGQFQKQFNITGSYPANAPSTVAIKTVHADGDLAVATFDYNGLNLQNFIVPFTLDAGKLITVYAGKPAGQNVAAPAVANGGTLDLGNLTIDLTQSPPRLFSPANHAVISKMTINPVFAKSYLAKVLNNPVFTSNKATGLFDLTIVDCEALPLGDLVTQAVADNIGKLDLKFSLTDLNIGLEGISGLGSALKQDSFVANAKDSTVAIARGLSTQHISLASGQYAINFDGTVRLADKAFIPLNMTIGPLSTIFEKFGVHDKVVLSTLPAGLTVPVEGTVDHASVPRLDKAIGKLVTDAVGNALKNQLLGGDKNKDGKANPLGDLLKGLGKKDKKDNKKDKQ